MRELMLIIEGKAEKQTENEKSAWEQTRWLAYVNLQPHLKKGSNMKPGDLIKFPWEQKPKQNDSDREKRRQERFAKWDADIKKKSGLES